MSKEESNRPSKKDLLDMLRQMCKSMEELPPHALTCFVTNYDLLSVLLLLSSILEED